MESCTPLIGSFSMKLSHWEAVDGMRYPWARSSVAKEIREWMEEVDHADLLAAAGEKMVPLLLTGETRCGKTSTLAAVAKHYKVPAFRMSISTIIGGYMGDTIKQLKASLEEASSAPCGLWVLDEVDGIFQQRTEDGQGANKERNAALAAALSTIEDLPPHVMLVATTNEPGIIDRAMLARFRRVDFPAWKELEPEERRKFAKSHGCEPAWQADSYAQVVQQARTVRVGKIIAEAAEERP
jgi:SpoVK/Ycf46/Vps4 family AAA+-type ATPase